MPCSDGGPSYDQERLDAQRAANEKRKTKEKIDKLTRLLCFVMTHMTSEQKDVLAEVIPSEEHGDHAFHELDNWWLAHQEKDRKKLEEKNRLQKVIDEEQRKRALKAEARIKALKKLTAQEREVLGL